MSIAENIRIIRADIPEDVTLVAVSKTKSLDMVIEAYNSGQRDFGENYIQELMSKFPVLPRDIRWHFIGHLQTNKVKFIVPFVHLIHGIDSFKLLKEVEKQARKASREVEVLLQVHISDEETKFGFEESELSELFHNDFQLDSHVKIVGLMGMASNSEDRSIIAAEFSKLKRIFDSIKSCGKLGGEFSILSMGMSNDYKLAIELGSNMIRIGSFIFGTRS